MKRSACRTASAGSGSVKEGPVPGCGLIMRDHSARAECTRILGPKSKSRRETSLTEGYSAVMKETSSYSFQ